MLSNPNGAFCRWFNCLFANIVATIKNMGDHADKLENTIKNAEDIDPKEILNAAEELEKVSNERDDALGQVEELQNELDEAKGTINQLEEDLDTKSDPDMMAEEALNMAEEQKDAEDVLKANNAADDDITLGGSEPVTNSRGRRRLYGHALRVRVVNRVRVANNRDELTELQMDNESFVKGVFNTYAENAKNRKRMGATGHHVVNSITQPSQARYQNEAKSFINKRFFNAGGE